MRAQALPSGPNEPGPPRGPLGRVEVHPGSGLVLRRGDVVLVVPVVEEPDSEAVDQLVHLCTDPEGRGDGGHLPRLARLVSDDATHRLPAFACLTGEDDHVLLMAYGAVPVMVDGRGPRFSSAGTVPVWVERSVPATFTTLTVGVPGTGPDPAPGASSLDLVDGGVPGGGVTLHLPRVTVTPSAAVPVTSGRGVGVVGQADRADARTVLRTAPQGHIVSLAPRADSTPRHPPLPVGAPHAKGSSQAAPAPDGAAGVASPVQVTGIVCPCAEFNSPDAEECRACGSPLDRQGPRETRVRPPLGILITDDGRVFTLTDDVVVGREPGQAAEVRTGRARPLVLRDGEQSTSRVHAQIRLSGWTVDVVDRGSANGTFLSRSGPAGPWIPVRGGGTPLAPGDRLRLGKRELMFDRYDALRGSP